MTEWFSATRAIETIEVEICFLLSGEYDGKALSLPAIPRTLPSLVRSSELAGHEALLAQYYRQVLALAGKDGKAFTEIAHYFWMRLFFWNTEAEVHVSFPWYDTYSEMQSVLRQIRAHESGGVLWDIDQGWEINIEAHEGRIYVRQWDPDDKEVHTLVNFPMAALDPIIPPLMTRVENTIQELSRLLGADVWTTRVEAPQFHLSV